MQLTNALLFCASLVASAVAQASTPSRIAFTVLPNAMQAGKDITLHWGGGDGSAVTITLQQGSTTNLQTVELVTGSATGTSYTWPVPKNLPNADNYAFRIQQADANPNYTGMISLTGGATTGPTDAASALAAASSTAASSSSSASPTSSKGSSGAVGAIGGSSGSSSSANSSSAASSMSSTAAMNGTTTAAAAKGTGASASGTGMPMSRNTTMSMATLSASSSSSMSSAAASSTTGGSSGTSTGGSAPSTSSPKSGAVNLASNFALIVCAVAGIVYLG